MSGGVGNNNSAQSPSKSIICSDSRHSGAILLTDDAHSVGMCRMLVVVWQFKAYWVCQAEQQQFYSVKQSCRHRGSSAGQVGVNVLKGGIILRVQWSCWGLYESDCSKPALTFTFMLCSPTCQPRCRFCPPRSIYFTWILLWRESSDLLPAEQGQRSTVKGFSIRNFSSKPRWKFLLCLCEICGKKCRCEWTCMTVQFSNHFINY